MSPNTGRGLDLTKQAVGKPVEATQDLQQHDQFTITFIPGSRAANAEFCLMVRYSLVTVPT